MASGGVSTQAEHLTACNAILASGGPFLWDDLARYYPRRDNAMRGSRWEGAMSVHIDIGQIVRRRDQTRGASWGLVVGLVLMEPAEALVCWSDPPHSTFELVDNLVDAIQSVLPATTPAAIA